MAIQVVAQVVLAGAVNAALRLRAFECGDPAPPQVPVAEAQVKKVRQALEMVRAVQGSGPFLKLPLNVGCAD